MKKILQFILKMLARLTIRCYRPKIVGITGSVGKTSAKEAIYTVLSSRMNVRKNIKNYNNEIGLPLTILGERSAGKSIFGWIGIFWRAKKRLIFEDKNFPEALILEMGVDRPGDMDYLTGIAKCDIGVVTTIGQSHLEFFGSIENIQKEKGKLIRSLKKDGRAILNLDNKYSGEMADWTKEKALTYGLTAGADIVGKNINYEFKFIGSEGEKRGVNFVINFGGKDAKVNIPNVIGLPAVYAALAGAAAGTALGLDSETIVKSLGNYRSPKGRLNLIDGANRSLIIDDTYNSSPQSAAAALELFGSIALNNDAKKITVLGDMLELGAKSRDEHFEIGKKLVDCGTCRLITVGGEAEHIAEGAKEAGFDPERIESFSSSHEAGLFVKNLVKAGDLILVKGSQGVRMERVVWQIMADPSKAGDLLVRQDEEWKDK